MSTYDAEYHPKRRLAPGIAVREPISPAECPRRTTEPRRLEQLPWPRNLFGELASIGELMAESDQNANDMLVMIPQLA